MTESEKNTVRELVEMGLTDSEISEKTFYSRPHIRRVRIDMGIKRKKGMPIPEYKIAKTIELRKSGCTKCEIAKQLHMGRNTVRKILNQEGIE